MPAFRRHVMYVHQRPALREGTVEENLRIPFTLQGHRQRQFDTARIEALLAGLGRDRLFLAKQQRDLSGGEAQLTGLLRGLQLDPQVLLLDEPTAALDRQATAAVEKLVAGWLDEDPGGRATVWVSHDPEQSRRVARRLLHIADGRLRAEG